MEPIFQRLYSYTFDLDGMGSSVEVDRPAPNAIFLINFDKVRSTNL